MFFFWFLVNCDIPVGTPVFITPEFDSSLQISFDRNVIRLKSVDTAFPGFREENTVIMRLYEGKYEITMQGSALCHCPDNNEIVGCSESEEFNLKSLYDIFTTEKGYFIKQDGSCWYKGEYDPFFKGYIIRMKLCDNSDNEVWRFEDVELNSDQEDQARLMLISNKQRYDYINRYRGKMIDSHPELVGYKRFGFGTFLHTTDPTKLMRDEDEKEDLKKI